MCYENSTNKIWGQRTDGLKCPSASFPLLLITYAFHCPYFLISVAGGQVEINHLIEINHLSEVENLLEKQERISVVRIALKHSFLSFWLGTSTSPGANVPGLFFFVMIIRKISPPPLKKICKLKNTLGGNGTSVSSVNG